MTLDRFRGCLLGGALGDALGYPIEFLQIDQIRARFGDDAPFDLASENPAPISDDTQMTLFTAEGLIRAKHRADTRGFSDPISVVGTALVRWYETQGGAVQRAMTDRGWLVEEPRLHARRAPGDTCMSALAAIARGGNFGSVDAPPNDSKGCGAVMRAAPCGLAASNPDIAFRLARDTGVITHGHPSGYLSGAYLAAAIWHLVRGTSLVESLAHADALLARERGHAELRDVLARARATTPTPETLEQLGGGWTGEEALAIAVACVLAFDRDEPRAVELTLWRAAAHSGDSDSTAAIAGNLLGAMLGADALPAVWLQQLELADVIDRVARDLHAAMVAGRTPREYPPN